MNGQDDTGRAFCCANDCPWCAAADADLIEDCRLPEEKVTAALERAWEKNR